MSTDNGWGGGAGMVLEVAVYVDGREPDDPAYSRVDAWFALSYDPASGTVRATNDDTVWFPRAYRSWGEVAQFAYFLPGGPPVAPAGRLREPVNVEEGRAFGFEPGVCTVEWDRPPPALLTGEHDELARVIGVMFDAGDDLAQSEGSR